MSEFQRLMKEVVANDDMIEGYRDGFDRSAPEPGVSGRSPRASFPSGTIPMTTPEQHAELIAGLRSDAAAMEKAAGLGNELLGPTITRIREAIALLAERDELEAERAIWIVGEQKLSAAYVRLREIIPGALDTPTAPAAELVWSITEAAARKLCDRANSAEAKVAKLREALGNVVAAIKPIRKALGPIENDPAPDAWIAKRMRALFSILDAALEATK